MKTPFRIPVSVMVTVLVACGCRPNVFFDSSSEFTGLSYSDYESQVGLDFVDPTVAATSIYYKSLTVRDGYDVWLRMNISTADASNIWTQLLRSHCSSAQFESGFNTRHLSIEGGPRKDILPTSAFPWDGKALPGWWVSENSIGEVFTRMLVQRHASSGRVNGVVWTYRTDTNELFLWLWSRQLLEIELIELTDDWKSCDTL